LVVFSPLDRNIFWEFWFGTSWYPEMSDFADQKKLLHANINNKMSLSMTDFPIAYSGKGLLCNIFIW